jgi:hypothetical protein
MAGDWIKLEHATPDKPEIVNMSSILKMDQDAVFGKCVRLWIWADQQTVDGNALSVTEPFIDRLTFCPGFAAALRHVGWLSGREGRLMIPNFDRHNGQTAKNRAQTKARVERSRSTQCNATSVTKPLPEKRREKNSLSDSGRSDFGDEVSIPEAMQRHDVQQAAAMWFRHLEVTTPDKLPPPNSPQMQAFWNEAHRFGPDVFVRAVESSVARGWKNLRYQLDDEPNERSKPRGRKTDGKASGGISAVEAQRQSVERMLGKIAD